MKKQHFNFLSLISVFCLLFCFAASNSLMAQASYSKKVNVIVTDEMNGISTVIDTLLPSQSAAQRFLRIKGYDSTGINRAANASKGQRKISVRTREILESDYYNIETGEINLDKYLKIPAEATVKETDGIREVEWVETDNNGNITIRSATVNVHKRQRLPQNTTTYEIAVPDERVRVGESTPEKFEYLKDMSNVTENRTIKSYPKFTVTVATTDIFDLNTLDGKADWLQMARGLPVEKFIVSPDYNKGKFLFRFDLAEVAEDTKMEIFDVVGLPVYSEDLSDLTGSYSKFLPDFNLYKRGTYLVMITQKSTSQKFTQKVIIE
ncbi:MAG: hypothetical protein ACPGVB_14860 [Chitinophagales bacterium]